MTDSQTIPAVHKAIGVMQWIAGCSGSVSVKEVCSALNIPQATGYRLMNTLLQYGWLQQDRHGGFQIGFGFAGLARAYSGVESALRQIEPLLHKLSRQAGVSAKITLREGDYVTTVLRSEASRPNAITSPVGYRFHIAIGSAAAALLSHVEDKEIHRILSMAPIEVWKTQTVSDVWARVRQCRKTGFCRDLGVQHPAIHAISGLLPLTEDTIAAVTLVGWPEEFTSKKLPAITRLLKQSLPEMRHALCK